MLLIYPPVAKPCEPPAGIAKLHAALHCHGIPCRVLDANLEGLLWLSEQPITASDNWTRRAIRNLPDNLSALRNMGSYSSHDRYALAVRDVNRVLAAASNRGNGVVAGLTDYHHPNLSALRSTDLITAAEHPEQNPYYPYFSERLTEILDSRPPGECEVNPDGCLDGGKWGGRVVGFSLNYLSQALCTFAMIGYLRKRAPGLKLVLGGGLVTSWMMRPGWNNPFCGLVDQLIAGPGEIPLLTLFGVPPVPQNHVTPDYRALPMHGYLSPGFILPYSGASGCYWNACSFCPEKAEGNRYHPVPVKQVMTDLHLLAEQTNPVLLHLLDNAISPTLMRALIEDPPKVPWYGFARFGRELADPDFCMALKRSGCVMLKLGLESGDQGVLDKLRKGIDIGTASNILTNLKKAGIPVYLYLLFGTPAETLEEARKTLEFVTRHHESIGFLNLSLFNMPIGGHDAEEYETEPFYEGDLSLYTGFRHPGGWSRKLVRHFLVNEFKREPAVAAILRRDPPLFTSNHAAFFSSYA